MFLNIERVEPRETDINIGSSADINYLHSFLSKEMYSVICQRYLDHKYLTKLMYITITFEIMS